MRERYIPMKLFKKLSQSQTEIALQSHGENVRDRIQIKPSEINIQSSRVTRQYFSLY